MLHIIMFHLAILPALLLLLLVVGRNKGKSNPAGLLLLLALGGVLSIIPAIIVELIGSVFAGVMFVAGSAAYNLVISFLVVAMIEELGKLGFLFIFSWTNRNFDHSYDGVIYAVCSSMGFAVVENIFYVFSYGMGTGIVRAFSAVPLHCACGVVMGFFYARARERANEKRGGAAFGNVVLAYLLPLIIHGGYDFTAFMESTAGLIVVLVAVILAMLVVLFYAAQTNHIIREDPTWVNPYNFGRLPMYPRFQQTQYTYGCAQQAYVPRYYMQQPNAAYAQPGYIQPQMAPNMRPAYVQQRPNGAYVQPGRAYVQPNRPYTQPGAYARTGYTQAGHAQPGYVQPQNAPVTNPHGMYRQYGYENNRNGQR